MNEYKSKEREREREREPRDLQVFKTPKYWFFWFFLVFVWFLIGFYWFFWFFQWFCLLPLEMNDFTMVFLWLRPFTLPIHPSPVSRLVAPTQLSPLHRRPFCLSGRRNGPGANVLMVGDSSPYGLTPPRARNETSTGGG